MNSDLMSIWTQINRDHFDGTLTPPGDIEWHDLSDLRAFGLYIWRANSIAIDTRFRFRRDGCEAGDPEAQTSFAIAYGVVLHEMIHQALHQRGVPRFGKHDVEFVAEATRIANRVGTPPPTPENAYRWPHLQEDPSGGRESELPRK